jgi:hypothetical protein
LLLDTCLVFGFVAALHRLRGGGSNEKHRSADAPRAN